VGPIVDVEIDGAVFRPVRWRRRLQHRANLHPFPERHCYQQP
jgi:hypothetical protein